MRQLLIVIILSCFCLQSFSQDKDSEVPSPDTKKEDQKEDKKEQKKKDKEQKKKDKQAKKDKKKKDDLKGWSKIKIPGTQCGDGSLYHIFKREAEPANKTGVLKKTAVYLMGKGACWSKGTCFGIANLTPVSALKKIEDDQGMFSRSATNNPLYDYDVYFFPYCTGDVHVGKHVAKYDDKTMIHGGRDNVRKSALFLESSGELQFKDIDDFVLYGYSAGGIGALFHGAYFDSLVRNARNKTMIVDSPGLHFGETFWQKFPVELRGDLLDSLNSIGVITKQGEGNVAHVIPGVCRRLFDWNIGVLQGSRDIVMSRFFGSISMKDHEKLVYGPEGLYKITENPNDRCLAWVPQTRTHVFLRKNKNIHSFAGSKSAYNFVKEVLLGTKGKNYK